MLEGLRKAGMDTMNRDTHRRLTAILATRVTVIRECAYAIG